ncbi:glycoside hydrolase family 13 protein [Ideonella sp.]|uniref:glycoside hydrolase family 13 protein n=1 Tax=Ideonella sp. TaxID=1929293 RepID=UPI003BB7CADA
MSVEQGAGAGPRSPAGWRQDTVYQIYPRSFCDSNGDGIGDLPGILSRLDHLQALGVGVVWLSPVYQSPNDDNGYDISDYRAIHPEFGTLADFDALLAGMHQRGIKLMMDLVVNHTSDEHAWFQQARSARDNPFHDFYIWREPRAGQVGGQPGAEPNNWEAAFNGSVWTWNEATQEYYLHMFSPRQPDLNWENPQVRAEVCALMRFWLDRGVDGFRMDVINVISKPWNADGSLPDAPVVKPGFLQPAFTLATGGPRLTEFLQQMRREALAPYETLTVGEMPCVTPAQAQTYTAADSGALNMVFQFEHMDLDCQPVGGKWALKPLHLPDLKRSMGRWQQALHGRGWNSLYLGNHDQPRPVSRFGDDGLHRVRSAKLLAMYLHGLQGTPYVYQGEELGMTNLPWPSVEACQDLETRNWWRVAVDEQGLDPAVALAAVRAKSRDNARTPMQWSAGPGAGFTTGTPWLPINANADRINADAARADPDSVFHLYRQLIALRRSLTVLVDGHYQPLLEDDTRLAAYLRQTDGESGTRLLVVCNFSGEPLTVRWPDHLDAAGYQTLVSNLPGDVAAAPWASEMTLQPWEARWALRS